MIHCSTMLCSCGLGTEVKGLIKMRPGFVGSESVRQQCRAARNSVSLQCPLFIGILWTASPRNGQWGPGASKMQQSFVHYRRAVQQGLHN